MSRTEAKAQAEAEAAAKAAKAVAQPATAAAERLRAMRLMEERLLSGRAPPPGFEDD